MKPLSECMRSFDEDNIEYVRLPVAIFGDREMSICTADGDGLSGLGIRDGDQLIFASDIVPKDRDVVMFKANGSVLTARQLVIDEKADQYRFRMVCLGPREDIISSDPEIYGVLIYILKPFGKNN